MSDLLHRPNGANGKVHNITAQSAGWAYLGFALHRLIPGQIVMEATEAREVILVVIEGTARISGAGENFGELGERMDVFERTPPHAAYIPESAEWMVEPTSPLTLAVCSAPSLGGFPAQTIGPDGVKCDAEIGLIHDIAMEDQSVASSLLVRETFLPPAAWADYPPFRHDADDFPQITYLEKTCYHRLAPDTGFGLRRVFTDQGSLNEAIPFHNHDVVCVPKGYHPGVAAPGHALYTLSVMAGPIRKLRRLDHPDHIWPANSGRRETGDG